MAIQPALLLTVDEYLEWEEGNLEKHEYIDGEVRRMAGAKGRRNRIMSALNTAIGRQLDDSDCFLLSSEMRLKVGESRYYYPDLSAVCGEILYARDNEMELLNPVFIAEVTSPSSMEIDRGEKRDFYLDAPSIQEYLIVDQHRVCVETPPTRRPWLADRCIHGFERRGRAGVVGMRAAPGSSLPRRRLRLAPRLTPPRTESLPRPLLALY